MTALSLHHALAIITCVALAVPLGFGQNADFQPASPAASTLDDYIATPPPGWSGTRYPDGIVLTSPRSNTGEQCLLSLWPMRAATDDLPAAAYQLFREIFSTYEFRSQTSRGTDLPSSLIRGTSGQGWDYVVVKNGIRKPSNGYTTYETLLGFVLVARLNDRIAVISGMSKDPLVSTCMGELGPNAWPRFFYSLGFRNWPARDHSAASRSLLAGTWISATASAGDHITFAANGRYGNTAASQTYNRVSNSEVLATTQAYSGNGAFALSGNTVRMQPDNPRQATEDALFRVEEESHDGGRSWARYLYLLRVSSVDGKDYELRYRPS